MAKGGLLQALAPVLGIGAALAAPELLPALGIGEAATGGATEAAATLADTVGGIGPEALLAAPEAGLAGEAVGTAVPLGAEALSTIGDVTGLGAAGGGLLGADAAAAGGAPSLGAPGGSILGADQAAAAPSLATTAPAAAPVNAGAIAATPAAPGAPGANVPFDIGQGPDLTRVGSLTGPAPSSFLLPGTDTAVAGQAFPAPDLSAAGGSPIGDFAGKAGDWALTHPGALLTAGIAGESLLKGNPQYPAAESIQGIANPLGPQGASLITSGTGGLLSQAATTAGETAALTAPLTTGILPPGLQQTVDQATQAQKAEVKSTYAAEGLSGSTMEADKLAQVDANAASQKAGIAEGLLSPAEAFSQQTNQAFDNVTRTGATLSGLSLTAFNDLVRTQMASDQNYQAALYKFAAALAGGGYQPPTANA